MHGNVYDCYVDRWHDSHEKVSTDGCAWLNALDQQHQSFNEVVKKQAEDSLSRLLRGGSWSDFPMPCRSACRDHYLPDDANNVVGQVVVCLPQGPSLNP
jgi:formylglycine-generating enzyme required for sulfatase activity